VLCLLSVKCVDGQLVAPLITDVSTRCHGDATTIDSEETSDTSTVEADKGDTDDDYHDEDEDEY